MYVCACIVSVCVHVSVCTHVQCVSVCVRLCMCACVCVVVCACVRFKWDSPPKDTCIAVHDMAHSLMQPDSFIRGTRFPNTCAMTHSYRCLDIYLKPCAESRSPISQATGKCCCWMGRLWQLSTRDQVVRRIGCSLNRFFGRQKMCPAILSSAWMPLLAIAPCRLWVVIKNPSGRARTNFTPLWISVLLDTCRDIGVRQSPVISLFAHNYLHPFSLAHMQPPTWVFSSRF